MAGIQLLINIVMPLLTVNYPLWWLSYLKWKFSSWRISSTCDFCFKLFQEDPSKKTLITNLSVILFFNFRRQDFFLLQIGAKLSKIFLSCRKKNSRRWKIFGDLFRSETKNRKLDRNRKRFQLDRKDTLNKKFRTKIRFNFFAVIYDKLSVLSLIAGLVGLQKRNANFALAA